MLKFQLWLTKAMLEHLNQMNKLEQKPSVVMVKDLLEEDIDGHVIYLCAEAARIAKPDKRDKHRPFVGMPVIQLKQKITVILIYVTWVLV